jgi:methionine biosynthesis protein MetW
MSTASTVLDVGCGTGGFLQFLARVRPDVNARGTDISDRAIEIAQRHGLDAFQSDPIREPLDREYDYITAFEVVEHVQDAEALLLAMRNNFRRQLIISCPNSGYYEHRIRLALFGRFPNTNIWLHAKEHIRFWTVRDFTEWVDHYGLRLVDVQGSGGIPRLRDQSPSLFAPQVVYTLERR